jgi:hypothetical protein
MAILLWWGLMIKDGILGIHNTETLWPDEFTIHILHTHKIMCLIFGVLCIKKIYHHIKWHDHIYIQYIYIDSDQFRMLKLCLQLLFRDPNWLLVVSCYITGHRIFLYVADTRLGRWQWNPIGSQEIPRIWANYNISLTWIKAIWGWFPLLTMISSEVVIIYPAEWFPTVFST